MKNQILSFYKLGSSVLLTVIGLLFLSGCETGESAFRHGDYAEAARVSADKLARKPDNEKAAEIFLRAYPQARAEWLARLNQSLDNTSDPFRWERALSAYEVLQGLSTRASLTPFAGSSGIEVVYYHSEIQTAQINAANARIEYADELMASGDLYAAREAYGHYEVAMRYAGRRDDLLQKLDDARRAGTLLVGIDPVEAQGHSLNPGSMMAALVTELEAHSPHGFVAFVPSEELGELKAVQYLQLTIGEVSVVRSEAEVGQKAFRRVLDKEVQDSETIQFEVKATVFRREKTIALSCPARVRIFEGAEGDAVLNRELPGNSAWSTQWDVLQGDKRALGGYEVQLAEPPDPEHARLMQQLAEALAAQARDALENYYKNS